jgi:hypothetical protein
MGPVERIRALGWVQNGKDARTREWPRMGKGGKTAPAWAKVEKQPPHGQKTLAVCAKNYCSMRKSGKTAPNGQNNYCSMRKKLLPLAQKWKKLLQYAQKTIAACAKVGKQPQMGKITIAVCAKNYCRLRKSAKMPPA